MRKASAEIGWRFGSEMRGTLWSRYGCGSLTALGVTSYTGVAMQVRTRGVTSARLRGAEYEGYDGDLLIESANSGQSFCTEGSVIAD